MKHALIAIALAWLAMCAGGPSAFAAQDGPAARALPAAFEAPLQLAGRTLRACIRLPGSAVPLCRGGALPARIGKVVSAGPAAFADLDGALSLVIDAERRGWLCLLDADQVRCAPVEAPAPQNVDIRFWHLPGDYHVVTYTHIPGTAVVLDPGAQVINAFQTALEAAAARVRSQLAAGAGRGARLGGQARVEACSDNSESGRCDMEEEPPFDPHEGGGGGGDPYQDWDNGSAPGTDPTPDPYGGWDNGPGPAADPSGGRDPAAPSEPPAPWSDPYCDNGPCPDGGIDDYPPLLPPLPRDPDTDTADLSPCDAIIPGIISICIRERRPPPPDTTPLPAGPAPWFPQSWCDVAGLFCSNGQIQKSAESGKSLAELVDECSFRARVKLDLCKVDDIIHPNTQRYADCLQAARDEYEVCVTRARDLTDNGAHPAP